MSFLVSGASINAHVLHGTTVNSEKSPISLRSSFMEGLYNGLRIKILGDEKNPPLWCYICNKVERGSKLNECGKCQKMACDKHS
uniref:Uncharacterized protein n=1 Tax=Ditylenchus dipsaci TaxID=166011 RepID=A0A915ES04_9BILA